MKYTGSKARISKEITQIFNRIIAENNIENYIEPFVGGANVIENIVCKNRYGFDNNEYLIALWKSFSNGYVPPNFIDRDTWHEIKNNKNNFPKELVGLAGICASYNGNWFTSYGAVGIRKSNGKIEKYYEQAVRNIQKQIDKLKGVVFSCRDYKTLKTENMNNFFIYCDPPYSKRKDTYDDKNFNHDEFWNWIRNVSKNNFVVVSEYQGPDDFCVIWEKQLAKTHPNQKATMPTEKLFVHKSYLKGVYKYENLP